MALTANGLAKNYEQLTPRERLRMLLAAQARKDFEEVNRLRSSCPRKVYRTLDRAFDAADDAVMTLVFVFCIDLAHLLGMAEMVKRLGRATEVLLILAAGEAGGDVANTVSLTEPRHAAHAAKGCKANGNTAASGSGGVLSEAAAALSKWLAGDADAVARYGAECLPQTHQAFQGLLSEFIADQVADVRSILEGLSRFTRKTLGVESIDVIRAWMPCIARRIEKLPRIAAAIDTDLSGETERIAWKYWRRTVIG